MRRFPRRREGAGALVALALLLSCTTGDQPAPSGSETAGPTSGEATSPFVPDQAAEATGQPDAGRRDVETVATTAGTGDRQPPRGAPVPPGLGGPANTGPPCHHPFPCGSEWPDGLEGPFELEEVRYQRVTMDDGVEIEMWIGMPDLPDGVEAPVILNYTPYTNFCTASLNGLLSAGTPYCVGGPNDPRFWEDPETHGPLGMLNTEPGGSTFGMPPIRLVHHGYAIAIASMRGTAGSGGCIDAGGERDQRDVVAVIDWLASQPWSNGRIGMTSGSYESFTQLMAAVHQPPALKSMVMWGNWYDFAGLFVSPQGAANPVYAAALLDWEQTGGVYPPVWTKNAPEFVDPELYRTWGSVLPERFCENLATRTLATPRLLMADDRDPDGWFAERDLGPRLGRVQAALLDAHGFMDTHVFMDTELWSLLSGAPKRRISGPWGHSAPIPYAGYDQEFPETWRHRTYEQAVVAWSDYWLKGIGDTPEHLGLVDYQDVVTGTWRQSTAWPPADRHEEVLFLAADDAAAPGQGDRRFTTLPSPLNWPYDATVLDVPPAFASALCPDPIYELGVGANAVAYFTEDVDDDVVIAGNPFAWLDITSDRPSGEFAALLLDVGPEFSCEAGQAGGWSTIAWGAIDLRHHQGNMRGQDFPVGVPTHVRIDWPNVAHTLQPGHRLAVLFGYTTYHNGHSADATSVSILAGSRADASHVVIPLVDGTLGGELATLAYPPSPLLESTGPIEPGGVQP